MPMPEPIYLVDITSGVATAVDAYLQKAAQDLGNPEELGILFPTEMAFDFSRVRVSVRLCDQRLRDEDAQRRERERRAGIWQDKTDQGSSLGKESNLDDPEEAVARRNAPIVRDWEEMRGEIHAPTVQHAIFLGDPGFGKSWLLRYEGRGLAQAERVRLRDVGIEGVVLPLFAPLGALANEPGTLLERLRVVIRKRYKTDDEPQLIDQLWPLIIRKAKAGKLLLLLDGWDEVRQNRDELRGTIESFRRTYPQCRLYLTSRFAGYVPLYLGNDVKEYELVQFSPEQIETFVRAYFANTPEDSNERQPQSAEHPVNHAEAFLEQLQRSHRLYDLVHSPLLLALVCRAYWQNQQLPEQRGALYDTCIKGLLFDWRWRKHAPENAGKAKRMADRRRQRLAEVSLYLLQTAPQVDAYERVVLTHVFVNTPQHPSSSKETRKEREEEADDFINELERDGILITEDQSSDARYRFLHRTFAEYLAAAALARRMNDESNGGWRSTLAIRDKRTTVRTFIDKKAWDPAWHEVITLLAGQLENPDLLLQMLSNPEPTETNPSGDDLFRHRLVLAAHCMAELDVDQRQAQSPLLTQITTDVFHLWWAHATNFTTGVVTHVAQALAALATVNAQMGSGRFLDHIAAMLHNAQWNLLWSATQTVGVMRSSAATTEVLSALVTLLRSGNENVLCIAAEALGQLGRDATTPTILTTLLFLLRDKSDFVRLEAAKAVGCLGRVTNLAELLVTLPASLRDTDPIVRGRLAHQTGVLSSNAAKPNVLSILLALLRDNDPNVRWLAALAVDQLRSPAATTEILTAMFALLRDSDSNVRVNAVEAVAILGDVATRPQILITLLTLLRDPDGIVRYYAARAVGKLGRVAVTPEILVSLLTMLRDPDNFVRHSAVHAVGQLGSPAATPEILTALLVSLRDADRFARAMAADAVGQLGSPAATPKILTAMFALLRDPHDFVRSSAAKAVGKLGKVAISPEILVALLTLLRDPDQGVRYRAAEAVGCIGSVAATPDILAALLPLLHDTIPNIRGEAVKAVGKLGSKAATPEILTALLALLRDESDSVRDCAAKAVGQLGKAATTTEILTTLVNLLYDVKFKDKREVDKGVHALHHHHVRIFLAGNKMVGKQTAEMTALYNSSSVSFAPTTIKFFSFLNVPTLVGRIRRLFCRESE